jgi:uncharacterized protein YciI
MYYIAHFQDGPDASHLKRLHAEAHGAFLARHAGVIFGESSRFVDDLGRPTGAMWLLNSTTRAAALALCHEDPYWQCGARRDVSLVAWVPGSYDLRVAHA